MQELMIDLETLGTNPKAPVISIGLRWFDLVTKQKGDGVYLVCDVADQIDSKVRFADASTLKWWMSQSGAAKKVFKDNHRPTKVCLQLISDWILAHAGSKAKSTKKCYPWGNGATFDISLLESLFIDYGVKVPWLFYNVMDFRTYRRFNCNNDKVEKTGIDHNALDDADSQIDFLFKY